MKTDYLKNDSSNFIKNDTRMFYFLCLNYSMREMFKFILLLI